MGRPSNDTKSRQCSAKWVDLAITAPDKTVWNWGRVWSRLTPDDPRETPDRPLSQRTLDGQPLAAFGTARVDHGTAAAGLHAHKKPVRACAANLGRLVSTFHNEWSSPVKLCPGSLLAGSRRAADYRKFCSVCHIQPQSRLSAAGLNPKSQPMFI